MVYQTFQHYIQAAKILSFRVIKIYCQNFHLSQLNLICFCFDSTIKQQVLENSGSVRQICMRLVLKFQNHLNWCCEEAQELGSFFQMCSGSAHKEESTNFSKREFFCDILFLIFYVQCLVELVTTCSKVAGSLKRSFEIPSF